MAVKTIYPVSEGKRFASDVSLTCVSCATCHMRYAIPTSLYKSARAYPGPGPNGWRLTCPLGHEWWYVGQSKDEQLQEAREAVARERARHDQTRAHLHGERIAKSRFRNERDRLKTRAAAGVCPCCNRTFKQLAAHMKRKHPEFPDA